MDLVHSNTMARSTTLILLFFAFGITHALDAVTFRIVEQLPVDTYIGNVKADAELYSEYNPADLMQLRFSILPHSDTDSKFGNSFSIDQVTGILKVIGKIDREGLCEFEATCTRPLDVAVAPAKFFRVITVNIEIIDVNDNAPRFDVDAYRLNISEASIPGSTFNIPAASDPDGSDYGIKRYEIVPEQDEFDIRWTRDVTGNTEVRLVLADNLDRETTPELTFRLVAYDGGDPVKSAELQVTIMVTDINDNDPQFDQPAYQVQISEDIRIIPTTVITISATDPDESSNGQIQFSLSPATVGQYPGFFQIDADTGILSLMKGIDREMEDKYSLVVIATDKAKDARRASATVTLLVDDVNDNAPIMRVNVLTESGRPEVSESADVATFVALLSVSDKDAGENGNVRCELDTDSFALQTIQANKYKVVTNVILDRETKDTYTFVATCKDNGSPNIRSSSESITIHVIDSNDHNPVCERDVVDVYVWENNQMNDVIVKINASDADVGENGKLNFKLIDDVYSRLRIASDSGVIYANSILDHEDIVELRVHIEVTDHGDPQRTTDCLLVVHIKDQNDVVPTFTQPSYTFVIVENQDADTEIGSVTAIDTDSPPHNDIIYSMHPADPNAVSMSFKVHPKTGLLQTTRRLDREESPFFYMIAVAENIGSGSYQTSASVTVFVADTNDNAPNIDFPNHSNNTVEISNKVTPGFRIAQIMAHDIDSGNNADLAFYIRVKYEQDPQLFGVDPNSGEIFINKDVRDMVYEKIDIEVIAKDKGKPPRKSSMILTIVVDERIAFLPPNSIGNGDKQGQYGDEDSGSSLVIIIAVVATSGVLIVILLAAIAFVLLKSKHRNPPQQNKYKADAEALEKAHQEDAGDQDCPSPADEKLAVVLSAPPPAMLFTNHYVGGEKEADKDDCHSDSTCNSKPHDCSFSAMVRGAPLQGAADGLTLSTLNSSCSSDCSDPNRRHPDTKINGPPSPSNPEVDRASASSGEISTADSGRGASEEGDHHHDDRGMRRSRLHGTSGCPSTSFVLCGGDPGFMKSVTGLDLDPSVPARATSSPMHSRSDHTADKCDPNANDSMCSFSSGSKEDNRLKAHQLATSDAFHPSPTAGQHHRKILLDVPTAAIVHSQNQYSRQVDPRFHLAHAQPAYATGKPLTNYCPKHGHVTVTSDKVPPPVPVRKPMAHGGSGGHCHGRRMSDEIPTASGNGNGQQQNTMTCNSDNSVPQYHPQQQQQQQQQPQNNNNGSLSNRQTVRNVKARDRSKKNDFVSNMIQSSALLNRYSPTSNDNMNVSDIEGPCSNFHDASSMLNYKIRRNDSIVSQSEITDDASTTSGSYVIHPDDYYEEEASTVVV